MYVVLLFFLCYGVLIGRESAPIAESAGKLRSAESAPARFVDFKSNFEKSNQISRKFCSTFWFYQGWRDRSGARHAMRLRRRPGGRSPGRRGPPAGGGARRGRRRVHRSGRARVRRERPPFTVNPKPFTRFCRTLAYACAAKIFYRFLTN